MVRKLVNPRNFLCVTWFIHPTRYLNFCTARKLLESHLIRMLYREEIEDVGGAMPPSKPLREDWIEIFERWVLADMPETPADLPTPEPDQAGTPEAGETPEATSSP